MFAQGPIGLCATAGARLIGATTIIAVESVPERMEMARRMGADHVVDFTKIDPVEEIRLLTDGRAPMSPWRRSDGRKRSRLRCACSGPVGHCRHSGSVRAISGSRS